MNLAQHIASKVGSEIREVRETYATKADLEAHEGIIKPTTSTTHPSVGREPGDAYIEVDTGHMIVWMGNQWAEFQPVRFLPPEHLHDDTYGATDIHPHFTNHT